MLRKNSGQIVVAVILLVTWLLAALTGPWPLAFAAAASICAWVLGGSGLGAGVADKIRAGIAAMVEMVLDRIGGEEEDTTDETGSIEPVREWERPEEDPPDAEQPPVEEEDAPQSEPDDADDAETEDAEDAEESKPQF